jgi:hypothetical protein
VLANICEDTEEVERRARPGAKLAADGERMLGMFSNSRRGSSSGLANGFSWLRGLLMEFLVGAEGAVIKSGLSV